MDDAREMRDGIRGAKQGFAEAVEYTRAEIAALQADVKSLHEKLDGLADNVAWLRYAEPPWHKPNGSQPPKAPDV
jgi:predicted metal-dependent hydrolase